MKAEWQMGHHIGLVLHNIQQRTHSDSAGEWAYWAMSHFEHDALPYSAVERPLVFQDSHPGGLQIDGNQMY